MNITVLTGFAKYLVSDAISLITNKSYASAILKFSHILVQTVTLIRVFELNSKFDKTYKIFSKVIIIWYQ